MTQQPKPSTARHWNLAERTIGAWTWKPDLLWSKVVRAGEDECWSWQGAVSPHANLFGGKKNGKPQMSQASRFIWMDHTGEDIQDREVIHTCGNRYCTNFSHMLSRPNHMRFRRDGTKIQRAAEQEQPQPDVPERPAQRVANWWVR